MCSLVRAKCILQHTSFTVELTTRIHVHTTHTLLSTSCTVTFTHNDQHEIQCFIVKL